MNGFTLFRRGECLVCGGIRKDCRRSNESGMVFCRESSAKPSGFIFRGLDRWGFGLWQPTGDAESFAQKSREEWQWEQEQRRIENERRRQQQIASQLPAAERDRYYQKLLKQLSLNQEDLCELQRRGFTLEQIKADGFLSVAQWERVNGSFPSNLPGLLGNGNLNSQPGIIFPVRDVNNRIVALSIRLTDGSNGRYRWLTSATKKNPDGASPHLNGELPLSIFEPGENRGDAVWLTEGLNIKPSLTRYRLGVPVVGASSGLFSGSPNTCQTTLEKLSLKYQTKRLIIPVDAGDIQNHHVCQRWVGEFEFLKSLGYNLQLAWWGQYSKDDDDIDELDDLSVINFIGVEDFLAWAETAEEDKTVDIKRPLAQCRATSSKDGQWQGKQEESHFSSSQMPIKQESSKMPSTGSEITQPSTGSTLPESSIRKTAPSKSANPKRYIKPIEELPQVGFHIIRTSQDELLEIFDALKTKRGQEWLQLRRFTPDITIDSQYFNYDFKPGENLAVRSGLGTGKSFFTNAKWLANPDEGAVLGGYRNCLNEQFCANGEKLNGRPWYQIQVDLKNSQDAALISDPQSRIAGAVDSWVYFASHHFDGKKVIFDEVESVAKHLNQSSTAVSFYREIIKQRVSDALTSSTANLIADGNLRDFTVEYFEKLSGGKKFTKILNTYTGNRGKIHLYNGSSRQRKATEEDVKNGLALKVDDWISFDHKPDDFSKLHRVMVDLPVDIPLLLLSDSQKKCEAWDRELSAKDRKVFRLDSTTSTSDLGRLFLRDPKSFILKERIDTVILSPSAESGVSIELLDELKRKIPGYFKYEFAFFFGVSVTDIQTQFLGRNRDPYTNKFVYVQTHSMPITRQITDEENSEDIFSMWAETMKDCASLSLQGLEEGEILKIALEKIKAQLLDPHTQYEAKLLLKESFEQKYPRLCLEYALRESGWELLTVESREDDLSDLRAMEREIASHKAMAVFSAEEITSTEADQLARKLNKTPEERNQITKSRLISRLPGITQKVITVEKIVQDEQQFKQIEESQLEKVTKVEDLSYPEWQNSPSQEIPAGGLRVTVEKPAFDPDFVNKVLHQDRAFVSRIEAQFLLRNPEVCKLIQQYKWHKKLDLLTDPDSVSFGGLPMSRYRSKWLEIHTLYQMGIAFFLNPDNSWHDETLEAVSFWEQGKIPRNARNIGVKHEDDPCTYIGKVLRKFGLRTHELKQKTRPDGTRYREYSIREIDPLSQAVYECLEQRIKNQVSEFTFDWKKIVKNSGFKTAEMPANQSLQPAHLQPDNYREAGVEVCSVVGVQQQPPGGQLIESQGVGEQSGELVPTAEGLAKLMPYCELPSDFAALAEGFPLDLVEAAIALQSSQPERLKLQKWFEQLSQPELTAGGELAQTEPIESESLRARLSRCVNIPAFMQTIAGISDEQVKSAILELPAADRDRVAHYWRCLRQRGDDLSMNSLQIEDSPIKKPTAICVGSVVQFTNPDRLEHSQIFEGIRMKIKQIVADVLAFCQLPDGSEQTFCLRTLVSAT